MTAEKEDYLLELEGFCPICEVNVTFRSENEWLRDFFGCSDCGSVPRERAFMEVIQSQYPHYRDLVIHESSPSNRAAGYKLNSQCEQY